MDIELALLKTLLNKGLITNREYENALVILTEKIDYITGVMCEVLEKRLSSEVGARGIFKNVIIFMLVGIILDVERFFQKLPIM